MGEVRDNPDKSDVPDVGTRCIPKDFGVADQMRVRHLRALTLVGGGRRPANRYEMISLG